ncbi:hypothetical protein N2152v2_001549 [Parachlorella kessleri]
MQNIPDACKSLLSTFISAQSAALLNKLCGTDFQGNLSPGADTSPYPDDSPSAGDSPGPDDSPYPDNSPSTDNPPLPSSACITYFTSTAYSDGATACANAFQSGTPTTCPAACVSWFKGIPSDCVSYITQYWSGDQISTFNTYCDTNWQGGSPQPNKPSPFPSPSPEPNQPSPFPSPSPEPNQPSPFPSPSPSGPVVNSTFNCTGNYSWVPLDADQASQWGEVYPETGAHAALAGNCSYLYVDEYQTPSGCCSETRVDLFPWWQYDLGSTRQVKGVRLTPPHDDNCILGEDDTQTGPCYNRLVPSLITVGNISLPDFYDSKDYQSLLKSADGNETVAQTGVLAALQQDSSVCNLVTAADVVDAKDKVLDSVNIGCGEGAATDITATTIKGRYVTIGLTTTSPESLALCGIEICVKTK